MKLALSFLVLVLGLTTACDTKKKLDKMSETTNQMGESTKNIEETSSEISESTIRFKNDGREALSAQYQLDAFNDLNAAQGPSAKLNPALTYFAAMEFQSWIPTKYEDINAREVLFTKAAELFFSKIGYMVQDNHPIQKPFFGGNEWENLAMLSVGLSKINPKQEENARTFGFKPVSFYDVLKEGLSYREDYINYKPVPDFAKVILQKESTVRYLLQLRHNMFRALVLAELTNVEEGLWEQFVASRFGWSADLDQLEPGDIGLLNEFLWKGMETREYMNSINEFPEFNMDFVMIFTKGTIYTKKPERSATRALKENGRLITFEEVEEDHSSAMFLQLFDYMPWGTKVELR